MILWIITHKILYGLEIGYIKMKKILRRLNIKDREMFAIFAVSVLLGFSYLVWRAFFTIDYSSHLVWPLMLLSAETYSFIVFAIFAFASINIRHKLPSLSAKDINYFPSVDIFICTYNESENILRDTVTGCKNIKYKNKKIYLLDDGNRPAIKQLATDFGINYITRDNNEGFKAGNINNALKLTNSELIAVFDADHVPVSTFLLELVDYFKDHNTGIVQTPQHFMNPDPFQKNLVVGKPLSNEQDLFFRIIQPGLARWNAAICAGTNFIVRREPLLKVGGLPHNTVTEDMDLGLRLRHLGLMVRYHNKPLAVGLAPETFRDYLSQRLRWAAGTIQIFLFNRKVFFKDLTGPQKTFYLSGLLYYFFGFPRLIFIMSPILYLLYNIKPLSANLVQVGIFLLACYISKVYFFKKVAKKYRNFVFTDIYETAVCFYLNIAVIKTLINPKDIKFSITNKGVDATKTDFMMFLPQAILLGFAIASIIIPIYNLYQHIYTISALVVNLLLDLFNIIVLTFSIKVALEKKDLRKDRRIPIKIEADVEDENKRKMKLELVNLSKKGVLMFAHRDKSEEFNAILEDTNTLTLPEVGKINLLLVRTHKEKKGRYYHFKFDSISQEKENELTKLAFRNSNSW